MKVKKLLKRIELDDIIINGNVFSLKEAKCFKECKIKRIGATKLNPDNYHSCPTIIIYLE